MALITLPDSPHQYHVSTRMAADGQNIEYSVQVMFRQNGGSYGWRPVPQRGKTWARVVAAYKLAELT